MSDEVQYLNLLKDLLNKIEDKGFQTNDRTGVGTCKIFGAQMRFDLEKGFPLFTHKRVFMRGIFEELMWFLNGDTNIRTLLQRGVHIWTEWRYKAYCKYQDYHDMPKYTMKEFEEEILNSQSFANQFGDIGKGYGHQWRNFGEIEDEAIEHGRFGQYTIPYYREGIDQIDWVVKEIKKNPNSRRLIVSGWNPQEVDDVDLPPCHTLFQFFVEDGKLSCQLYQRSADILLGVPFNIASYALLTHLIAAECGLGVGEFIWTGGDIHVYKSQLEGLEEIVNNRYARKAPTLKLRRIREDIRQYQWQDIIIEGYDPLPKVEMPVAV
ncbi:thymidylate synthase [Acinetobacter phage vB_AbaM_B09_Aci05]|uniref:Thymidylate synthase n=1 Tax=Acinetobacter phage vB_AbaM_B09_Aci05 TaxID=2315458 RepID=A0A386KAT4_9CAUD|nr:thymidylate synthase [Acinetobacter phage vB_AbaM_B09_Aci05]AYD82335.1 thymidylate synthase [Acinetobacter phage vB_AbaM_B09_Aci05]QMP19070.1 thymidylate synthase [Acinetobacter phage Ab_121]